MFWQEGLNKLGIAATEETLRPLTFNKNESETRHNIFRPNTKVCIFFPKQQVHNRAALVSSDGAFLRPAQPPGLGLIQNAS